MSWIWIGALTLPYLVPLLRLTVARLVCLRPSTFADHALARLEYLLYPFRQTLLTLVLWIVLMQLLWQQPLDGRGLVAVAVLVLLDMTSRRHKQGCDVLMAEFLRQQPFVHPGFYYDAYKQCLAWGRKPPSTVPPEKILNPDGADFRRNLRATQSRCPLLSILFDTGYLSFIIISSLRRVGPAFATEIFDAAGSLWGFRTLELFHACFTRSGMEKLQGLEGRFLFVFNHKSSADFMLGFLSLSGILMNHRGVKLRYIIAKDHFRDNPIVYSLFGVGKVCEAVGMIFIERKKREKGFENLRQAADALVHTDVDLAIYPQGTRANVLLDRAGKRRDAGYYTTITSRDRASPLAHLRKGTAHLIANVLEILEKENRDEPLHVVFVGIKGTATALPNNTMLVQTEADIQYDIGDVVSLSRDSWREFVSDDASEEARQQGRTQLLDELHAMIHDRLKKCLDVNNAIAQRFLADLQGYFRYDDSKMDTIAQALFHQGQEDDTVFALIDRIHALPVAQWNAYLSELSQYLQDQAPPEKYEKMLEEVSGRLV